MSIWSQKLYRHVKGGQWSPPPHHPQSTRDDANRKKLLHRPPGDGTALLAVVGFRRLAIMEHHPPHAMHFELVLDNRLFGTSLEAISSVFTCLHSDRQPTNNTPNNTKSLCYSATEFQLSDIFPHSPPNRMHSEMSFALVGFATEDSEGGWII